MYTYKPKLLWPGRTLTDRANTLADEGIGEALQVTSEATSRPLKLIPNSILGTDDFSLDTPSGDRDRCIPDHIKYTPTTLNLQTAIRMHNSRNVQPEPPTKLVFPFPSSRGEH